MARYVFGNKKNGYGVGVNTGIRDYVEYEPEVDTPKWVAELIKDIHDRNEDIDWDGCQAIMARKGVVLVDGVWRKQGAGWAAPEAE